MSSDKLSKNQQKYQTRVQRSKRDKRKKQAINFSLVVVGLSAIVFALYLSTIQPITDLPELTHRSHPIADGNNLGDTNAPVTLEVYSDFKCPACQYFFETVEPQLIEQYIETGLVYYIYHSFGDRIHPPESGLTAQAVYCAEDQDNFWEMHDYIYAYGAAKSYTEKVLETMAINLGMDKNQFSSCLENKTYAGLLEQDVEAGIALDIPGTPSVIVNGVLVDGFQFAEIQAAIENELSTDTTAE